MTHMDVLGKQLTDWARVAFPHQTELTIAAHLLSEAAELYKSLGGQAIKAAEIAYTASISSRPAEEVSDVLMLALVEAGYLGVSAEAQVRDKMIINRKRMWTKNPNNLGFHTHIEEGKS